MPVAPASAAPASTVARLGPRLVAAAAIGTAGVALYCTRATLDLFRGPLGVARIAMLPSWPELAGLVVLSALVAGSLGVLMARHRPAPGPFVDRRVPRWPDRSTVDVLLPLFALVLLVVPYLPWIPDALPILRVFAGPARYLLWFVVLGQMALAVRVHLAGRPRASQLISIDTATILVFIASVAAFGTGAGRLAGSAIYPGGDEPHYLIITQTLLSDRDLKIENNHEREDYAAYFGSALEPHYRTRGTDNQIYSIHPVGLPFLAVPAFAIAGYKGVVAMVVLIAALAAALMWRWAAAVTESPESATFGWAAVALGAPYFFNAFAVYPEIPAALCVVLAIAEGGTLENDVRRRFRDPLVRGLAVAALPWLSTKYAPMAAALTAVLVWRMRERLTAVILTLAPIVASTIAWLWFFQWIWGSPLPSAPYGPDSQTSPMTLPSGAPGLLLDQEYGVFIFAPALMLSIVGWIDMWRTGGRARRIAVESVIVFGALLGTVGAFELWWGGSGIAGRPLVSGLPLMAPAIAWAYESARRWEARRAACQFALLAGLAITGTLLIAQGGLLLAEGRDGASELFRWLAPDWPMFISVTPSFIAEPAGLALARALPWIAALLVLAWIFRRLSILEPGRAALTIALLVAVTVVALGSALPSMAAGRFPRSSPPEERGRIDLLDTFDGVARPYAIVYTPLSRIDVHAVPPLFAMAATPGSRHHPQPIEVLLNARFSLPAGEYDVELLPRPGQTLSGDLGLQLGRIGRPVTEWAVTADAQGSWRHPFTLHLDSSFVGFIASDTLDPQVGTLRIHPKTIVDDGARLRVPTVLAASGYGDVVMYFHDDTMYTEETGFWVAGRSTLHATAALAHDEQPLKLRMHGGPKPSVVFIETPVWRREVPLTPGQSAEIDVPPAVRGRLMPLTITTYNGFVPAREGADSKDERVLGCWVEVK